MEEESNDLDLTVGAQFLTAVNCEEGDDAIVVKDSSCWMDVVADTCKTKINKNNSYLLVIIEIARVANILYMQITEKESFHNITNYNLNVENIDLMCFSLIFHPCLPFKMTT